MSKTQARQTRVLYSVTLPDWKALRSSSSFFRVVDIWKAFYPQITQITQISTEDCREVFPKVSLAVFEICVICVICGYFLFLHYRNEVRIQLWISMPNRQIEFCLDVAGSSLQFLEVEQVMVEQL